MKKKHDWNTLEHYLNIHEKVLRFYSKYFHFQKNYRIERITNEYLRLECNGIELVTYKASVVRVHIEKDVEIERVGRREMARTFDYRYHAHFPAGRNLIRYCGPHKDHRPYHHKHVYEPNKTEPEVLRIADDEYPHVGEFFNEVLEKF